MDEVEKLLEEMNNLLNKIKQTYAQASGCYIGNVYVTIDNDYNGDHHITIFEQENNYIVDGRQW